MARASGRLGAMSRRQFLAVGGGTAAAVVLAACTPTATAPAPAAPEGVTAAAPKRGGTLTWAQILDNSVIDPHVATEASAQEIDGEIFDFLVAADSDLNIQPWLATKWTIENNATKYAFTLRDDVTFHDGTPFDSMSVKKTIERIVDPATKAGRALALLGPLDHAEAPDPRTAILVFKEPNPLLLVSLWRPWFGMLSPKQLATLKPGEALTAPIGTGPYKLAGRTADGVTTLERNPDYKWAPAFAANRDASYFDTIKLRRIAEPGTRVATLESGESLLVDDLPEADYVRLKSDKRFSFVQAGKKGPGYGFFFNVKKFPASELAVRQAMNWAVDRQGIVDKLLFGVHHPCVGPLTEGVWGRLDELERTIPFSGDKKKAADILDAAGWRVGAGGIREKGGLKLSLVLAANAGAYPQNDLADAVQLQVREVGIDLQVQKMASNAFFDFTRGSYKHDLCDSMGANIDPDELRGRYHSRFIGSTNFANTSDPQLDDLLVKGQNSLVGSDARKQVYADAQRRMMELLPMLSLISVIRTYGMTNRLHGLKVNPTGINTYALTDTWLD